MTASSLPTFEASTCADWREWLVRHHDSASEVWLVFYKRRTGRPSLAYEEVVNEALCFGWIDSLVKRLDDERYARKFTPRKPDSKWSTANRKRFAALRANGRLMPPGLARPPTERSGDAPKPLPEIPAYILEALHRRPAAWKFFESLAPSHRRLYVSWINSAKRPETRARRLKETTRLLADGKKLGLK
jgi:uncharacterized protein YdeI (YjbR/CyaY-like superfamily)